MWGGSGGGSDRAIPRQCVRGRGGDFLFAGRDWGQGGRRGGFVGRSGGGAFLWAGDGDAKRVRWIR